MNYSPLRYPGGKARITPLVKMLMESAGVHHGCYIEPFVGGGGVALSLLLNDKVSRIVINDYDISIYSVWHAILNETNKLISLIEKTPITIEEWHRQKNIFANNNDKYSLELAFATFFLNRTNRSGILKAGPIGGYDQNGRYLIDARFNKLKLINKIIKISEHKQKIYLYNQDIEQFILETLPNYADNSFIYFDPPYYKKGRELYKNFFTPKDHDRIAELLFHLNIPWMITYDNEDYIENLYSKNYIKKYDINYCLANKGKDNEIIALSTNFWPRENELEKLKFNIKG